MKRIAMIVLLVSVGCATGTKSPERPAHAGRPPGCHDFECGGNGTRLHGMAGDVAPRVEGEIGPARARPR